MSLDAPKSPGCLVRWDDLPRVFASTTVYGACLGFGAGLAVLGASVSQLAADINVPDTGIGRVFVYRGLGFLLGALLSIKLLHAPNLYLSKHMICCVLVIVAGISLFLVPIAADHFSQRSGVLGVIVGMLFFLEGMCFGGIDAFSALAIAEMWGHRTQPWMQTKNLFSNFGCLIGPALVNAYNYRVAYMAIALLGCTSLLGFAMDAGNTYVRKWMKLPPTGSDLLCVELSALSHSIDGVVKSSDNLSSDIESNDQGMIDEVYYSRHNEISPGSQLVKRFEFPSPQKRANTANYTVTAPSSPCVHSPLPFASPELARYVRSSKAKAMGIVVVPRNVRIILAAFVFWELGLLCAYGGWIGTYVETFDLQSRHNQPFTVNDAESAAAEILAVFYGAQIVGSILSVPASVIVSTTVLLRCQLALAVGAGALMCIPHSVYTSVEWLLMVTGAQAGLMGLALGCMYPLIMTVVSDYGVTMTSSSTIAVVLGGCIGEATAPFLVSLAIARFGPEAFVVCIGALIVALLLNYIVLHVYLKAISVMPYEECAQHGDEAEKEVQGSPVLLRRRSQENDSVENPFDQNLDKISDRHGDSPTERCCYATESPLTLMNYTGFSSALNYPAFSDGADSGDDNAQEQNEVNESELASFVLPSARYHAVRCVNGIDPTNTHANNGTSGPRSRSRSPIKSAFEGNRTHAQNSPHKLDPVSEGENKLVSHSPGSHYGGNNDSTMGNSGDGKSEVGASLYAKSFRRYTPMLRHPLSNAQYKQLLQEEEESM